MTNNMVTEAITAHWGERCPEYAEGCPTCDAWKEYDDLSFKEAEPVGKPYAWAIIGKDDWDGVPFFVSERQQEVIDEHKEYGSCAEVRALYLAAPVALARDDVVRTTLERLALDWIGDLGRNIDDNEVSEAGLTRLKCASELRALLKEGEAR